jgi:hypothetical protein
LVFILLLFWCGVGGLVGWAIGNSKGRGTEGFWLGFLLGIIGWIIVAFMSPSDAVSSMQATQAKVLHAQAAEVEAAKTLRACPYCAEMIQPAAVVCRYCGRDVEPVAAPSPAAPTPEVMEAEIERRFPWFIGEARDAMAKLPAQPPDKVAWLEKYCTARRDGKSSRKATEIAGQVPSAGQWW